MADVFDLQAHLTLDISDYENAVKAAKEQAAATAKAFEETKKSADDMQKGVNETAEAMRETAEATSEAEDALNDANKQIEDVVENTADLTEETEKSAKETAEWADEMKDLRSRLDKANDELKKAQDEVEELRKEYKKAKEEAGDNAEATKELAKKLEEAENKVDSLEKEVDELEREYGEATASTDKFSESTAELSDAAGDSESKLGGFVEFIKNGLTAAFEGAVVAIGAATAAVVAYTKQAYDAYSSYEQLSGGVDTLFGDASDTVLENAKNAWKTTGMAQNEYLEMVTGFSASLLQSTGRGEQQDIDQLKDSLAEKYEQTKKAWDRQIKLADSSQKDMLRDQKDADLKRLKEANEAAVKEAEIQNAMSTQTAETRQRAAELADLAARDMSDNANKMGTDMQAIQNAYQGFAKGNYTMLDNLKLGYGGTKEEMERLLQTAEQFSGKEYSISSFADIVEAVHEVQSSLYISGLSAEEAATAVAEGLLTEEEAYFKLGTTAKEAEDTIEGSTKAMSALWENLKLSVASGDIEAISENINQLAESAGVFLSNAMPTIESILGGIGIAVEQLAPVIEDKVPDLIANLLPSLVSAATQLISAVAGALPGLLSAITDKETVGTILKALEDMLKAVMDGLGSIVETAPDIIPDLLEQVGNALIDGVDIIGKAIINMLPDIERLLTKSVPVLHSLVANLFNVVAELAEALLPDLLADLAELFGDLITGLMDSDNAALMYESVMRIITALLEAFNNGGEPLMDAVMQIIEVLFTEFIPELFEEHGGELTDSLLTMLATLWETLKKTTLLGVGALMFELWTFLFEKLEDFGEWLADIDAVLVPWLTDLVQKGVEFLMGIGEKLYDFKENLWTKLGEFVANILQWFTDLKEKALDKVRGIAESIGEYFRYFVEGAKQWGRDLIDNFTGGITENIGKVTGAVSSVADKVKDLIGFSEPKEGALSNFHTFAPDMIDLFAQGIRDNADKVYDEVAALASGISTDINADVAIERSNGTIAAVGGSTVINIYNTWEGLKIASEIDVDEMSDRAIERMSERLANLEIFSARAYGGVIMP